MLHKQHKYNFFHENPFFPIIRKVISQTKSLVAEQELGFSKVQIKNVLLYYSSCLDNFENKNQ